MDSVCHRVAGHVRPAAVLMEVPHDPSHRAGTAWRRYELRAALRPLDRRRLRPPGSGPPLREPAPVTGQTFCEVGRGTAEDIELALDAAHNAAPAWGRTSAAERASVLKRRGTCADSALRAATWR